MWELDIIDRWLEYLEWIRKRPLLYLGGFDPEAATHFLNGFSLAARAALKVDQAAILKLKEEVLQKRGWKLSPAGILPQIKKRKFPAEKVIDELIVLEIELWKKVKASPLQIIQSQND